MEMEDKKLKRFLQEELNREADLIMEEVDSDPSLKDVVAPDEIYDSLMQQIHEYEKEQANKNSQASEEEQELIRLGKLYKKKRSRRKYYVLLLAGVVVLAYGITSIGGGKKVFSEMKRMLGDKTQTVVNTQDEEGKIAERDALSEEEAYEQINAELGFYPIKINFLPEDMVYVEVIVEKESQSARLYYEDDKEGKITYCILTNNRTSSLGLDVEDKLVHEYAKKIDGTDIKVTEYFIEGNNTTRWTVDFVHKDVQYQLLMTGIESEEVEKIIENLYFS